MDGKLSQTELSSLKIYYLSLTLRVAFPLFLVLGSNAKIARHFQIWKYLANSCCYINVRVLAKFRYNPCKYWCFGIFCFKILAFGYNGWVLEENTAFFALEVSITRPS